MTIDEAEKIYKLNHDFQKTVMASKIPAYILFMHFLKRGLINKKDIYSLLQRVCKRVLKPRSCFKNLYLKQ